MKVKIILSPLFIFCFLWFYTSFFKSGSSKEYAHTLLQEAGITLNGTNPWDITVHNENLYSRVMNEGTIGLGEAYMDGWWDCQALDQFFFKILRAQLDKKIAFNIGLLFDIAKAKLINLQTKDRSKVVGRQHYDLGNDLFEHMLDDYMIYSCAYWKNNCDLNQAQENKLDLICKKLYLQPGMEVLDIGCGWGGFAAYAAKNYGVKVMGITISEQQAELARKRCKGLPVEILLQDYRDLNRTFDRIVSIGMFEHVGYKNYAEFMKIAHACLKDDGLFLLHTIGGNNSVCSTDPWMEKYIFPNSMLPSVKQISEAVEGFFVMEDWHNFSAHYDQTLMSWFDRFVQNWPIIKQDRYDERFYRMFTYYLLSCAALFRARQTQLWQVVLSKNGVLGGYHSIR